MTIPETFYARGIIMNALPSLINLFSNIREGMLSNLEGFQAMRYAVPEDGQDLDNLYQVIPIAWKEKNKAIIERAIAKQPDDERCWAITLWLYEMFGINTEAILGEEE